MPTYSYTDEGRLKNNAYDREYWARPENRSRATARMQEYRSKPGVKEREAAAARARRANKKK